MSGGLITPALSPDPISVESAAFLHCLYNITHGNHHRLVYVEQVTNALHLAEADAELAIQVLVAEELVKLRLQCILSITQEGINQVKAALQKPEPPQPELPSIAEPLAPAKAIAQEAQTSLSHSLLGVAGLAADPHNLPDLPPEPTRSVLPGHERDDLELKLICEAIGLDPRELNDRPSLPGAVPNAPSNSNHATANLAVPKQTLPPDTGNIARTLTALMLQLPKLRLGKDDLAEAEAEIATATAQLLSPRPKQPIIASSLTTLLAILDAAGPASMPVDLQVSLTEIRLFFAQLQG
jgi:hypothetical protein